MKNAQINGGPAPGWMVGEGQISTEQLVLVSVKRISIGCWVPTLRLISGNDRLLVSSHELSLVWVTRQLMFFLVALDFCPHTTPDPSPSV